MTPHVGGCSPDGTLRTELTGSRVQVQRTIEKSVATSLLNKSQIKMGWILACFTTIYLVATTAHPSRSGQFGSVQETPFPIRDCLVLSERNRTQSKMRILTSSKVKVSENQGVPQPEAHVQSRSGLRGTFQVSLPWIFSLGLSKTPIGLTLYPSIHQSCSVRHAFGANHRLTPSGI